MYPVAALTKMHPPLNDFDESAKCHELYLSHCLKTKSIKDQDKAYQELGQAYKHLGNLQQALVSFILEDLNGFF